MLEFSRGNCLQREFLDSHGKESVTYRSGVTSGSRSGNLKMVGSRPQYGVNRFRKNEKLHRNGIL